MLLAPCSGWIQTGSPWVTFRASCPAPYAHIQSLGTQPPLPGDTGVPRSQLLAPHIPEKVCLLLWPGPIPSWHLGPGTATCRPLLPAPCQGLMGRLFVRRNGLCSGRLVAGPEGLYFSDASSIDL